MKLNKDQIKLIERQLNKAKIAELKARNSENALCDLIVKFTGVDGIIDHLAGDGHGFTPMTNLDTHVSIEAILKAAKEGKNIDSDFIDDNLSF